MDAGEHVYRRLLRVFPPRFRCRYGADMLARFREQRDAHRGRTLRTVVFWIAIVADAVRHGLVARVEERRRRTARARVASSARARAFDLRELTRDVRHGWRAMRHSPAYAITVVIVSALGMALGATVFAVVDGVVFKPLPYPDAAHLYTATARDASDGRAYVFTLDEIDAWRHAMPQLGVAAFRPVDDGGTLGDGRSYGMASVDDVFFDVLGQRPAIGGFTPDQFVPGARQVAIISDRLWQRAFNRRPDVVGQQLPLVGGRGVLGRPVDPPIVVGVLPPDFVFPDGSAMADVIVPIVASASARKERNESVALALVRVPPGTTIESWQSRIDAVTRASQHGGASGELVIEGASFSPVAELGWAYNTAFRTLAAAAVFLVLLACAGIAGLTAARTRQRERDIVLRRALGASVGDLFRHALAGILPLWIVGAVTGLSLTPALLSFTLDLLPARTPFLKAPRVDVRVIGVVCAAALVSSCIVASSALWTSRRARLTIRPAQTTPKVRGFGRTLIAVQTALAFVVMLGGAFMTMSLWRAWQVDPGYERERIAVVRLSARAPNLVDVDADVERLQTDLARVPGVASTAIVTSPFLTHSWVVVGVESRTSPRPVDLSEVTFRGDFFGVLGIRPIEGRLPTPEEIERRDPIALVSERTVAALWPGESAVGRSIVIGRPLTVIGVVRDARFAGLIDRDRRAGQVFMPGAWGRELTLLLRTTGSPADVAAMVARQAAAYRPRIELRSAGTIRDALAGTISDRRFSAWLYGGYAICAIVITAVGIFGIVATITSLRTKEIGVRQALGARRSSLVWLLLREKLTAVAAGLVAGGGAAWWALGLLRRQLYGVAPTDTSMWGLSALTILAVAALATVVPAARASAADPAVILRVDG
jgi:predicted permease